MSIVAVTDVIGLTNAEYDAVVELLGIDGWPVHGARLHVATATDSGFRLVEVWDSSECFTRFLHDRLRPALRALGLSHATKIRVTPAHRVFARRKRGPIGREA
jgi:hypothetical protein